MRRWRQAGTRSPFRFPRSLQASGSGTGKPVKKRDGDPINYRAPAQPSLRSLRSWMQVGAEEWSLSLIKEYPKGTEVGQVSNMPDTTRTTAPASLTSIAGATK